MNTGHVWPLLLLLVPTPPIARPDEPTGDSLVQAADGLARATDSLVRVYLREQGIPGAALAVARGGKVLHAAGFGYADLEMQAPVTDRTLFRTASVLKPMTATAVILLAREGAIDLDQPIQRYCPAYPEKRWPVRPRELLVHVGGVRGVVFADVFNREHYSSTREALSRFAADSLVAEPGTKVVYSNAGYSLLACAIEGASGVSFDTYLREHVLGPAGMTATRPDNPLEVVVGRARGYMVRTAANTEQWTGLWQPRHLSGTVIDVPFNADPVDPTWSPGAGGYLTTPVDLVRFAVALLEGRLLPPDEVARITEPYRLATGESIPRSHGWVLDEFEGHTVFQVMGSDWNGSSALWVSPRDRLAIAVSTNKGFEQPAALITALAKLWSRAG